jgi:hypothetical protein
MHCLTSPKSGTLCAHCGIRHAVVEEEELPLCLLCFAYILGLTQRQTVKVVRSAGIKIEVTTLPGDMRATPIWVQPMIPLNGVRPSMYA